MGQFSLSELRYFILRVEHGSFTEAARVANVSQSALSVAIDKLESKLGHTVINRSSGEITVAGQAMLVRAREALRAVEAIPEEVRRATIDANAEEVRLGAGATACGYLLPPILKAFCGDHSKVRFRLREGSTEKLEAALERNELDLAVVTKPEQAPHRTFDHWREDELIVVARPDVNKDKAGWITFVDGSTRRTLLSRFQSASIVMELGSLDGIKGNLRAGSGLALISRAAVEAELKSGILVEKEFSFAPVTRQLILRHNGAERLSRAARELRQRLLADAKAVRAGSRRRTRHGSRSSPG